MADDDLMIICTFPNDVEADLAEVVLSANGIGAVLIRDSAMGMMPWLNTLHPIRLAVRASDVEVALRLLQGVDSTGGRDDAPASRDDEGDQGD